jgi:hypothetical protein
MKPGLTFRQNETFTTDHNRSADKTSTQPHLKSFILLLSATIFSVMLVVLTDYIAIATRYRGSPEYGSPIFRASPQNAIFAIQIFASLAILIIRECYSICCEQLRWSLATRGTHFFTFLALSESTGFVGILRIIFARHKKLFAPTRVWAFFRFSIVYIVLVIAHFIWMLNIDSKTVFVGYDTVNSQSDRLGIGDLWFPLGEPWPFSQVDSWLYLTDRSRVVKTTPTVCTPEGNGTCLAYVIYVNPINYTYECPLPPLGETGKKCRNFTCPSNQENCGINGIFYDIPSYLVEFCKQENNLSYEHCASHTSTSGTNVLMCLGQVSASSTTSSIDFLFDMCNDKFETKPCLDSDSAINGTMFISKVNVTLVVNIFNQTILDVALPKNSTPYSVSVFSLFRAYTAPLTFFPADFSTLRDADKANVFETSVHMNGANSSNSADDWVDSTYYGLEKFLKPHAYHLRVYGIIAHALAANSRKWYKDNVTRTWQKADEKTILSVSMISIYVFTALVIGVALICPMMMLMAVAGKRDVPRICLYPDIMIGSKVGNGMMQVLEEMNLSDASNGRVLEQLVSQKIWVARESSGRVVLSTQPPFVSNS